MEAGEKPGEKESPKRGGGIQFGNEREQIDAEGMPQDPTDGNYTSKSREESSEG